MALLPGVFLFAWKKSRSHNHSIFLRLSSSHCFSLCRGVLYREERKRECAYLRSIVLVATIHLLLLLPSPPAMFGLFLSPSLTLH